LLEPSLELDQRVLAQLVPVDAVGGVLFAEIRKVHARINKDVGPTCKR
jgi:hypothetical protein